jgi:hypothetical protein
MNMSTDKKKKFVDAKRVIGSHKSKTGRPIVKGKNDKQWSKKKTQKTEDWVARITHKTRTELCR